jgi:hypothetical protein
VALPYTSPSGRLDQRTLLVAASPLPVPRRTLADLIAIAGQLAF